MPGDTVLVIDDSPTILKLVQLVLTKAGYRVATASGGEAGLLAAKEELPAMILLDYAMPDLNGDDVCRAMSVDTTLSRIPVVVMSARIDNVGERFNQVSNVVDSITKPFSPEALLAVVTHTVEKQAKAAASAKPISPFALMMVADPAELTTDPIPADAALAGDLALISIADVLGLLQDQTQTGMLTLAQASSRLDISMRLGRIDFAHARGVPEEFLLGRFLVEAGQIEKAKLNTVIEQRKLMGNSRTLLGADLIAKGLLTVEGLRKAMALQTSALVYEGLRWGKGRFWFQPLVDLPPNAREAALGIPADALIMQALRRIDEWRLIEREIGDFDMVFVRNDERVTSFGRAQLLRDELVVLDFVSGRNSVKDIVGLTKMGSFDVSKMLYRLLRNKLIRRRVAPFAA